VNAHVSYIGPARLASADSGSGAAPAIVSTRLARWLPLVLLVIGWTAGALASSAIGLGPSWLGSAVVLGVLALVLRAGGELMAERIPTGSPVWTVAWGLHAVVVLALVVINPLFCIYAYVGYIDAERFLGDRVAVGAVVVTAVICAFGQTGGIGGVRSAPWLFGILLFVNVLIAMGMMRLAMERERHLQEREAAAETLATMHRENLALQESLMARAREHGIAAERERLSREIHDTVAQGLVAVITQLESVPETTDEATRSRIERAEQAARTSLAEARRAVRALASPLLDDRDLPAAMTELVDSWSRTNEISATFHLDGGSGECLHGDVLIRVTQEALSNVARHAAARRVAVTLTRHADEVRVDIRDDGRGFDQERVRRGHGLASMTERMRAVGGTLDVETAPGAGCIVSAAAPQ
jgi:signal transduction histidine kinase